MNKILLYILMLSVAGCTDAKQNQPALKVEKKLNKEHPIKVEGCEIQYKDQKVNFNSPLERWLQVFGSQYRAVKHSDYTIDTAVEIPKTYYVYDDLGVRLIYNVNAKKMQHMVFALERSKLDKDFYREETAEEYQQRMNDPQSYQAKQDFKDGILVENIILGAYPMDDAVRHISSNRHSTEYNIYANCNQDQKDGEDFNIRVNSSFSDPEIITGFSFYVHIPTEIPEDISLKQQYENCIGISDQDIKFGIGWDCPDIRKRYFEKRGNKK